MSRINTNVQSLIAQRILGQNNQTVGKALERLSTGLRINRGGDDPAGLIGSENLRAEKVGIGAAIGNAERAEHVVGDVFAGNRVPNGADPHAQVYGGHQFGTWAGQLGDGRAISLGEVRDANDGYQTLQLKGAGPTPYSRRADGRARLLIPPRGLEPRSPR